MSFGPAFATRDDTYDEMASRSAVSASDGVDHTDAGPERDAPISESLPETGVSVPAGVFGCGTPADEPDTGVTDMISGTDCRTDTCIAARGFNAEDTCGVGGASNEPNNVGISTPETFG